MRLDIRTAPSTRMMYSLSRRTSFNAVPSGERVWSSSSKGFTDVMLQQEGYSTNARRLSNSQGRIHRIWRRPSTKDKKRALARSQAPLYNSNLQIPQGSPPSRQVRRLKPELFLSWEIPKCLQTAAMLVRRAPDIRGTACTVRYNPAGLRLERRRTISIP